MSNLIEFLPLGQDLSVAYLSTYDVPLVTLSVLMAIFASFMALELSGRIVHATTVFGKIAWLVPGSVAMGGGVWAMHFIGMLAFSLPCGISYDPIQTLVSMVPGVAASAVALWIISRADVSFGKLGLGGVLMGGGIGTMHYSGMAAMRLDAVIYYSPAMFALSIGFAVVLAILSLHAKFVLQRQRDFLPGWAKSIVGAVFMGVAISGMHYIAMEAAHFIPIGDSPGTVPGISPTVLGAGIGLTAVMLVALTLAGSILGRHMETINVLEREISERRHAERHIRKLSHAVEQSPTAIVITDTDGNIEYVNRKFVESTGYSAEEAIGQNPRLLKSGHTSAEEYEVLWRTITAGHEWRGEFHNKRKDGTQYWEAASISPIKGGDGEIINFIAIKEDITERIKAEEDLRKAHDELELKVAERTGELEAAKNTAETANRAKSSFLANMSHEIRTPMNGVVGMVDVLMQQKLNSEQRRMVQTIKNSSFSLLRIIDDILDSSKIEAGKMELEYVPIRLGPVLEGIVETMVSSADEKNVRLSLFIDPAIPEWVYSDAVRLRQVLLNLTNNAVKFSRQEEGGEQGWVQIRAQHDEQAVIRFSVTDNGIGMSEEVRSRLFKPFSQGEESTTREFGGTGLGLVISANLVRLMGGAIEVDSTPGEGTVITVRLPFIVAEGSSMYPDISGLEVLALVDDLMNREVLSAYIDGNGATIRYAENEAELSSLVSASTSKDEPIVALALGRMVDNDRVREGLTDTEGRLRFLNFTARRSDRLGLVLPNSYVIQRFPILPSDVLKGLAILARRESPDVDFSTAGQISSASTQTIEEAEAQNRLVLLVEDDPTNQLVIKHQLRILGYAMEIADDGKQGLEMWQTGRFNLVLTDCHMPVMDGFELTDAIREAEKQTGSPHVPIVAITANALEGEAERCLQLGMDDYLSKPVELERLGHALGRWLPNTPSEATKNAADESGEDRP